MRKIWSWLGGLLIAAIGVISLSSVVYPPLFGTVVGFFDAHYWAWIDHGKSELMCGGSQRMTLRGQKVVIAPGALDEPLISAGGDCRIQIIDCDLEAPKVIDAGGSAHVVIRGGHIVGSEEAISSGGDAVVDVQGAKVEGKVSGGGSAKLVGIAAGDHGTVTLAAPPAGWNDLGCKGVADCFSQAGYAGNVTVHVTEPVAADGTVTGADVQGEAPQALKDCIAKGAKVKRLLQYDGKPGKLSCTLTGTINGGTQMLSTSSSFSH